MGKKIILFLFVAAMNQIGFGNDFPCIPDAFTKNYRKSRPIPPLLVVGGGYYNGGSKQPKNVVQIEYRFGKAYLNCFRPQAVLIMPALRSLFLGVGFGLEVVATDNILLIPSFSPGFYYKGSGKDLGYFIEFRSAFEVAYQWQNQARIGLQVYHISNGSLSKKNPGANACALLLSIPLR